MTYVIINGRGLAGLTCGDARDGAPVRGTGGRSLGVRGMQHSDAGLPRSSLSGLGAASASPDVEAGLAQLVSVARDETAKIVESAGFLSRGAVETASAAIVGFTQSVQASLTAKRDGVPFYSREPEAAARLLAGAAVDLRKMLENLRNDTGALVPGTLAGTFDMIITGVVQGLVRAVDKAVRAAVEEAGKLPDLPSGLPGWVAPAAGLLVLAVVAKTLM